MHKISLRVCDTLSYIMIAVHFDFLLKSGRELGIYLSFSMSLGQSGSTNRRNRLSMSSKISKTDVQPGSFSLSISISLTALSLDVVYSLRHLPDASFLGSSGPKFSLH